VTNKIKSAIIGPGNIGIDLIYEGIDVILTNKEIQIVINLLR